MPRYYDRQGFPIPTVDGVEPVLVWARMMEQGDRQVVAVDELPDGSCLSTVWLGLDHGFGGRPLIFETMRFCRPDGCRHIDWIEAPDGTRRAFTVRPHEFPDPETGELTTQLRYRTEEEALAAHHEILRRLRLREGH